MIPKTNKKNFWVTEMFTPHSAHRHHIKEMLVHTKTRFQLAQVADTHAFGRCLILDGEMQSAALDEFIYHESLVHPAFMMHKKPKDVLILGGGEGATLREILKHKSINRATMVDIDGEVVRFCKKYMTAWHKGSFSHKKTQLIIGDAKKFVEEGKDKYDVIISDLPTPIEAGPAYLLYTVEFYKKLRQRLRPGGLFVLQAGSGNLIQIDVHKVLFNTLKKVFPEVWPFYSYVPSFDVPWAFLLCGSKGLNPLKATEKKINTALKTRLKGPLHFYDGMTHEGLFRVPKYLRQELKSEKRVMTAKKPLYFYK